MGKHACRIDELEILINRFFLKLNETKVSDGSGDANYGNFLDCFWLFQVDGLSDPPPTISFNFVQFDLEWHFDSVTVYDGTSLTSPVLLSFSGQVNTTQTPVSGRTTGIKEEV